MRDRRAHWPVRWRWAVAAVVRLGGKELEREHRSPAGLSRKAQRGAGPEREPAEQTMGKISAEQLRSHAGQLRRRPQRYRTF